VRVVVPVVWAVCVVVGVAVAAVVPAAVRQVVMVAAMHAPGRPQRSRWIGLDLAGALRVGGCGRPGRPGRRRMCDPRDRGPPHGTPSRGPVPRPHAADGDRRPPSHRRALGRRRIFGIGKRGVNGPARHRRLHDDRLDRRTGFAANPGSDENPRQHCADACEDAWHDPLTREHGTCIPAPESSNRASCHRAAMT
jgi:hypothetical protein